MIHESAFPQLVDLDPVLTEIIFNQYNLRTNPLEALIRPRPISADKVTDFRIGGFQDPKEFDGILEYDSINPDYEIEYRPIDYAKGFSITKRMRETNQYSQALDLASNLGQAFRRKKLKTYTNLFANYATTVGYDGKTLCANDHPQAKGSSTTINNLVALALTTTNLDTAVNTLEAVVDENGDEAGAMATGLVYGRNNRKIAQQLIGSELVPDSANNAINTFSDMTGIYLPLLTGNAWFVVDIEMMMKAAKMYELTAFETESMEDFNTKAYKFSGYESYVLGWSDFRWVVGSTGG